MIHEQWQFMRIPTRTALAAYHMNQPDSVLHPRFFCCGNRGFTVKRASALLLHAVPWFTGAKMAHDVVATLPPTQKVAAVLMFFFWKFIDVPWVFMSFHDFPWCSRCDCHLSLAPVPTMRHHGASSENSGAPCNLRWVSLLFPRTESLYSEKQAMDAFLEIWVCLKMWYIPQNIPFKSEHDGTWQWTI